MTKPIHPVSLYTWGCGLFAAVGSLLYGIDSGIISTTISQPHFIAYFAPLTPSIKGAIVSIFGAGSFFGLIFAGWAADYWGRFPSRLSSETAAYLDIHRTQKNYTVCLGVCFNCGNHPSCSYQCRHAYCWPNNRGFCSRHNE